MLNIMIIISSIEISMTLAKAVGFITLTGLLSGFWLALAKRRKEEEEEKTE